MGSEWLRVNQFCERYAVGKNFVYRLAKERVLRSIKVGGLVLIDARAFDLIAERVGDGHDADASV